MQRQVQVGNVRSDIVGGGGWQGASEIFGALFMLTSKLSRAERDGKVESASVISAVGGTLTPCPVLSVGDELSGKMNREGHRKCACRFPGRGFLGAFGRF